MHLYEAHLPVADTSAAQRFHIEIVGLQFAHRITILHAISFFCGLARIENGWSVCVVRAVK
jgi:hypothetical protein